ncbi:unnamed protein product [Peniophora sp. CBMAI 1063]|nr:unnamed protein product [Peniophora sp. CBMAI 1063]
MNHNVSFHSAQHLPLRRHFRSMAGVSPGIEGSCTAQDIAPTQNRLFALIIGVNEYLDPAHNLSGAVMDALRIRSLLSSQQPPVSDKRIIFVEDSGATARRIVKFIEYLCVHTVDLSTMEELQPEIHGKDVPRHGDPIFIYYAGHGSTLPRPRGWPSAQSRIQCLSPHDACIGDDESVINVIPDRTFGVLLVRLAEAKGKNITVMLDCCHSGSGTRDRAVPRCIEFKSSNGTELTVNASDHPNFLTGFRRGTVDYLPEFLNSSLTSHVVLAACGPHESAYEDSIRKEGRFTTAFLSVLANAGTDTLTYADVINRLSYLPSQTPRCEGRDKETRILFDAGLKQRNRHCYEIKICSDQPQRDLYTISAGQIQGIGEGDVFAVFRSPDDFVSGGDTLGHLVVESLTADTSSASSTDGFVDAAFDMASAVAVLSRVKSPDAFRVEVAINEAPELKGRVLDALRHVVCESVDSANKLRPSEASVPRVATSSPATKATITIVSADEAQNAVFLTFRNGVVPEILGLERLCGPIKADKDTLIHVLRSAAHFFRHLGSSSLPSGKLDTPSVKRDLEIDGRAEREKSDEYIFLWVFRSICHLLLARFGILQSSRPIIHYLPPSTILLRDQVDIHICKLEGSLGLDSEGLVETRLLPEGSYIDAKRCGIFKPVLSHVDDDHPTQELYGIHVLNRSVRGIEYYSPPVVSGKGDPPLPAHMSAPLPLNYGDSGGIPLAFELPDGQDRDGGFLRLFLSTQYIDLSNLAQDAIVEPDQVMGVLTAERLKSVAASMWDAITIPVRLG